MRSALAWMSAGTILRQAVQFLGLLALTRLLSPEDFGLGALMAAVTLFASALLEAGLTSAVVQRPELDDRYLTTAFALSVGVGAAIGVLTLAAAPAIAAFYGHDALLPMIALSALGFALSAYHVPLGILTRGLRFRALAVGESAAVVVGQSAAILVAIRTRDPISLAIGPAVTSLAMTGILWPLARWRPRSSFSRDRAVEIWRYCRGLLAFNFVNYWSRNTDTLLLGQVASAAVLGQYNRAYVLMGLPVQQASNVLVRTYLPHLASAQAEPRALVALWQKAVTQAWVVGLPVAVLGVLLGQSVTVLLFGEDWARAGFFLQLLALSIPPQLVGRTAGALYQAVGDTQAQARIGLVNACIMVPLVATGALFGAIGVVAATAATMWIHLAVILADIRRRLDVSMRGMARSLAPATVAGVAQGAALALVVAGFGDWTQSWPGLICASAGGLLVYGLVLRLHGPVTIGAATS